MTASTPESLDDQLVVSCVEGSDEVHLGAEGRTLCGEAVTGARPTRLLVRNPCAPCVRTAADQGTRTVRDRTSAWVNLRRLAASLSAAA